MISLFCTINQKSQRRVWYNNIIVKLRLIKIVDEAKGTKTFFWEPEKSISFIPGQFLYYTLPKLNYPDPRGTTRHFTISSSPTESNLVGLTTRIREESGYKKTLDELPIGSLVDGEGPNGTFILNDNDLGPHVFIAGGIGITPFRSIIKYAIDKKLKTDMTLIYSNSIPEEIAFRNELVQWTKTYPNFKLFMTVTKPEESKEKWSSLTGRIDENLIKKLVPSAYLLSSTFWLCGPPPMVDAMETVLPKLGIVNDHIRSEKFTGY